MAVNLFGWDKATAQIGRLHVNHARAIDKAVRDEAAYFMRKVGQAFRKQGGGSTKWPALNTVTLQIRRGASRVGLPGSKGTKALVRSGDLRRSIQLRKDGIGRYFVGVHRTAKRSRSGTGKPGAYYADIARIHETGMVVIPITDRMRRYFRFLFWKGVLRFPWPPKNKQYIVIKRRSFINDTAEEFIRAAPQRVVARYWNHLGGHGRMKVPED